MVFVWCPRRRTINNSISPGHNDPRSTVLGWFRQLPDGRPPGPSTDVWAPGLHGINLQLVSGNAFSVVFHEENDRKRAYGPPHGGRARFPFRKKQYGLPIGYTSRLGAFGFKSTTGCASDSRSRVQSMDAIIRSVSSR